MRAAFSIAAALALLVAPSSAQTWSTCNPLRRSDCPPNPALGRSLSVDLRSGASADFVPSFNPPYDKSNGAVLSVAKSGDAPQLTSKWYIMFGKVSVTAKAAPSAGIVSSIVLQSDTLDEIDWEWLGADPVQVQSNYFSKGDDSVYNRGAFHADATSQSQFKTYTLEWTASQVVWQINGVTVRVLRAADVGNKFPQSPMQLKIGAWSGGDSKNAPGTIEWAKGPTDYSKGPFSMYVSNVVVQDYSTGSQYKYGDNSGSWQSIQAVGGKVNPGSGAVEAAPPVTSTATGSQPQPFTSTVTRPSVYPWIADTSSSAVPTTTITSYPGLPSGWTVNSSGRTIPPSSAPSTSPTDSSSSSSAQPSEGSSSEGAYESTRTFATRAVSQTASASPSSSNTAPPNAPPNAAPRMLTGSGVMASLAALVGFFLI